MFQKSATRTNTRVAVVGACASLRRDVTARSDGRIEWAWFYIPKPEMRRPLRPLHRRPPIAVKTEGHASREFRAGERPTLQAGGIEHGEIAAVFGAAINGREHITISLGGTLPARYEDRLGDRIARRELKDRALARFEIDMREHVETVENLTVAARGEKTVAIVEPGETLVEPRKFGGQIIDCLALEAVGVGGKVEGPAGELRHRLGGIARPAVGIGE